MFRLLSTLAGESLSERPSNRAPMNHAVPTYWTCLVETLLIRRNRVTYHQTSNEHEDKQDSTNEDEGFLPVHGLLSFSLLFPGLVLGREFWPILRGEDLLDKLFDLYLCGQFSVGEGFSEQICIH